MSEETHKELLHEVTVWKHNRALYPGWLVAPETVRETLWLNTSEWIDHFLQVRKSFDLRQELDVLFELDWRLSVALIPIPNALVISYDHVLTSINPFPSEIKDLPNATLILNEASAKGGGWDGIREQWLAIAFSALRWQREERKSTEFKVLHARLGAVVEESPNAKARWCYERCLFSFADLDDAAAWEFLRKWPFNTPDPFWTVRRASVHAELGDTDMALAVAEAAMERIREGLLDSSEHIPGLSREAWVSWLVMALRDRWFKPSDQAAHDIQLALAERAELRRRYNQLRVFGCSPEDLKAFFEIRLDQPPPRERPQGEETPSFHLGVYKTSFGSSDIVSKLQPAYQYMRLVEESALPPRFGRIFIGTDEL